MRTQLGPTTHTYRNERSYPFCPGCGHSAILDRLDEAFQSLGLEHDQVVIVTDIGCSGLSDQYFDTHAFHGLHGRSISYATGIKLADPQLHVVVIMGDGGTGIGGAHLLAAARRNIGITVLVMNNFNFGMTGGQHSTTTPVGAITSTTPGGNIERPLDICATVGVNGAGYVYRGSSFDSDLSARIAEAIAHDGFALLDIWELCSAYFLPRNKASKKSLTSMLEQLHFDTGLIHRRESPEFGAAYRESMRELRGAKLELGHPLEPVCHARLQKPYRMVLAGSAGTKVLSAGRLLTKAAVLAGLWATQKDDYPITVKTGHSVAEILLSPEPLAYTGIDEADALVILSDDGLAKVRRYLAAMDSTGRVYLSTRVTADFSTEAELRVIDASDSSVRIPALAEAQFALFHALRSLGLLPRQAVEAAIETGSGKYRRESMEILQSVWG